MSPSIALIRLSSMTACQNMCGEAPPQVLPLTFSLEDLFQALTLITGCDFDEAWHMVIQQLIANEAAEDA
ncbi:hypothetical protein SCP_0804190 [Sparassis crispa]|uniref:Uncharacterized protein n=1 Tax=Sparassis crispa TaxID=139825 RepID=A0A401GUI5_9APHY|nr:hypothetical protein SCP_0804190 [Sparassis crispa]GBE85895.1 hypothetical protein SCP_0804190 [Sparassis crispa]